MRGYMQYTKYKHSSYIYLFIYCGTYYVQQVPQQSLFLQAGVLRSYTRDGTTCLHANELFAERRHQDAPHVEQTLEVRQRQLRVAPRANVHTVVASVHPDQFPLRFSLFLCCFVVKKEKYRHATMGVEASAIR